MFTALYPKEHAMVAVFSDCVQISCLLRNDALEKKMKLRSLFTTVACVALSACSGTMQGVVRGEGTRVPFEYEQGMDRDYYRTTIDGESFSGQAIDAGSSTGVGTVYSGGAIGTVVTTNSSGNFVAVLLGDRGSTMRCQMNYADSSGLTSIGGVGLCQHSDGRVIDVTW